MHEYANDHFLTRQLMDWFFGHYVARVPPTAGRLRLAHECPGFSRLPPAMIITAECDPLRDQGEAYAGSCRTPGYPWS